MSDLVHSASGSVPVAGGERGMPCIECGSTTHRLSDGREAYPHRPDLHSKRFWFCPCGAFVGCHPGTEKALGAPAGAATKQARMAAHRAFDPIWKRGLMSRSQAYKWLAEQLSIQPRDCHISHFNAADATRAAQAARHFMSSEQSA